MGKSTLIRESFSEESSFSINLLNTKQYRKYQANPEILQNELKALDEKITHVIIDEVQKVPELLDEVHYYIESVDTQKRFFCLSGSSARKLKKEQANLLGGRAWMRFLYPFSYEELVADFDLARVLRFGSLPGIYFDDDEAATEKLDAYVDVYLNQEIKAEAIVRNANAFSRFLNLAAVESGNLLNYSNIAREAGTSYKSIQECFQILEDTLIGFFLQPYDRSQRKSLVKHPKFYLFDNGVRNALLNKLGADLVPFTYDYGNAFEHFIINEVLRINQYHRKKYQLNFYRTNNGAEVDLIIQSDDRSYAVEIKSSQNPSKADFRGLYSFKEVCPKAELVCVSRVDQKRQYDDVTVYPWEEFLLKLINHF